MRRCRLALLMLAMLFILFTSGCQNIQDLVKRDFSSQPSLIKVRIHFDRGDMVEGYVYELGLERSGKLYAGGSSISYIYDAQGNVVGSFNYQRVTYMEIIPLKMITQLNNLAAINRYLAAGKVCGLIGWKGAMREWGCLKAACASSVYGFAWSWSLPWSWLQ